MPSVRQPLHPMIVTIDGPAGAGKTSVSKQLAQTLGYRYIDTGALYRGVALAALQAGISDQDDAALDELCSGLSLDLIDSDDGLRLMLNDADITDAIRTPEISMMASAVSARPVVRDFLLATQRDLAKDKMVVAEGRDMGTVVFPRADVKFYLDADPKARARRRFAELSVKPGQQTTLKAVESDMHRRDENDANRQIAPLKPAADAIRIDSTPLSVDQVIGVMMEHIAKASGTHP